MTDMDEQEQENLAEDIKTIALVAVRTAVAALNDEIIGIAAQVRDMEQVNGEDFADMLTALAAAWEVSADEHFGARP